MGRGRGVELASDVAIGEELFAHAAKAAHVAIAVELVKDEVALVVGGADFLSGQTL